MKNGKLEILDACCNAGCTTVGYMQAGFAATGVDVTFQPNYAGDTFMQGDAVAFIRRYGKLYDAIHASPPCRRYSITQRIQDNSHPDLIDEIRKALNASGRPWVMENVEGAPLRNPVVLCGAMFGLQTYRHRLFETGNGFWLEQPEHPIHIAPNAKMGRPVRDGEFMHIVGNFSDVKLARSIMGHPTATRDELREGVPAAYTKHVGDRLMNYLLGMRGVWDAAVPGILDSVHRPEPLRGTVGWFDGKMCSQFKHVESQDGGQTWRQPQ